MAPRRRWTLSAAAAAALAAAPGANADDFAVSPGAFLQLTFGADWNLGIGFDIRGAWLAESASCFDDSRQSGVGIYAQGVFLFRDGGLFLGAGLHGGVQPRRSGPAWDVELGWMWRSRTALAAGGHGLQLGLLGSNVPLDAALRVSIYHDGDGWVPEGHLAGGGRIPGVFGADGSFCVEGRPQRAAADLSAAAITGRVLVRPSVTRRPRRFARTATRRALGLAWAEAARAEAASVPAFLGLARDLTAVGAPSGLVERALVAAADEVRHARACAAVAGRFLGAEVAAEVPAVAPAPTETRDERLQRLSVEALRDGCVGEGAAAARARLGARRAGPSRIRRVLRAIATEESAHAALAADVIAFCRAAGGSPVDGALVEALSRLDTRPPSTPAEPDGSDGDAWLRGGRVTPVEAARLTSRQVARLHGLNPGIDDEICRNTHKPC